MLERLIAELSAACSQIGYDLGHKYELDANCFGTFFYLNKFYSKKNYFLFSFLNIINIFSEVIKDFIKYLRRDDNDHNVRRYLGQCNVLTTDLVKVFVQHSDNEELWDLLLR